MWLTRIVGDSL